MPPIDCTVFIEPPRLGYYHRSPAKGSKIDIHWYKEQRGIIVILKLVTTVVRRRLALKTHELEILTQSS